MYIRLPWAELNLPTTAQPVQIQICQTPFPHLCSRLPFFYYPHFRATHAVARTNRPPTARAPRAQLLPAVRDDLQLGLHGRGLEPRTEGTTSPAQGADFRRLRGSQRRKPSWLRKPLHKQNFTWPIIRGLFPPKVV